MMGLLEKIKQHKAVLVLILLLIFFAIYVFYPRNLYKMIFDNGGEFYVIKMGVVSDDAENDENNDTDSAAGSDTGEVQLTEQQMEEIRSLFQGKYGYINLFGKKYSSGDGTGYYCLVLKESGDMIYFLSKDIISIDGKQYRMYNRNLEAEFEAIIENEEA